MEQNVQQSQPMIVLKKIWPYINRAINSSLYFILNVIKGIIKTGIDQIKGSF